MNVWEFKKFRIFHKFSQTLKFKEQYLHGKFKGKLKIQEKKGQKSFILRFYVSLSFKDAAFLIELN